MDAIARTEKDRRQAASVLMDAIARTGKGRRQAVSQMQAVFRDALSQAAKEGKAGRVAFASQIKMAVAGIKETVSDLLNGVSADLEGAHKAWSGNGPAAREAEGDRQGTEEPSAKDRKTRKARK
jgi:predicted nucleic acid-binding Zn ribbon protein